MGDLKTGSRRYLPPGVAGAILLTVLGLWAWQEHTRVRIQAFQDMRDSAEAVSRALVGAMRPQVRREPRRGDRFVETLESVVETTGIRFLAVRQEARVAAAAGEVPAELETAGEMGECLDEDTFILWRTVRFQGPLHRRREFRGGPRPGMDEFARDSGEGRRPRRGSGRGGRFRGGRPGDPFALDFGEESQLLVVGMNAEGYLGRVAEANARLAVVVAVGGLCVIAIIVTWVLTIRGRVLGEELRFVRARAAYLEELGLAATGLAHETKNPLGVILGLAQRIVKSPEDPKETGAMAEHIIDAADRAAARLGDFIVYAKGREANLVPVDARGLLDRVAEILRPDFEASEIKLQSHCDSLMVLADEEMLRQILVNLLLNSLHASARGATIALRLERRGQSAALTVEDQGRGIAPELLPNIFKPYVTSDPEGHGLGLTVVQRFVDQHGWSIGVDSGPGRGTRVMVSGISLVEDAEPNV